VATYQLSGHGVQSLSGGVTGLHIDLTTLNPVGSHGRAYPINLYDQLLLRAGDGVHWGPSTPIDAEAAWVKLPGGTTIIAFAFLNGASADVTELF
jgi:hypothetical protein